MHLEGVIFCQWWAQCHEWMAQMLQCICFPSQLKQTVSFLLGCLALAADDGNYTVLPFPVVYTQPPILPGMALLCAPAESIWTPSHKALRSLLLLCHSRTKMRCSGHSPLPPSRLQRVFPAADLCYGSRTCLRPGIAALVFGL